jgi:hypothetical protein
MEVGENIGKKVKKSEENAWLSAENLRYCAIIERVFNKHKILSCQH